MTERPKRIEAMRLDERMTTSSLIDERLLPKPSGGASGGHSPAANICDCACNSPAPLPIPAAARAVARADNAIPASPAAAEKEFSPPPNPAPTQRAQPSTPQAQRVVGTRTPPKREPDIEVKLRGPREAADKPSIPVSGSLAEAVSPPNTPKLGQEIPGPTTPPAPQPGHELPPDPAALAHRKKRRRAVYQILNRSSDISR